MYDWLRRLLFLLPPETSHALSLCMLDVLAKTPASTFVEPGESVLQAAKGSEILGLSFPNRVGLAAGLDKNADHFNALAKVGFGFVEVGTVTPRPQPGNPRPRLFRIPEAQAIINRMGFNNKGVDHLCARALNKQFDGVLGINIGKNLTTDVSDALSDYLRALQSCYPVADYVTVNISSPNTPGLRELQHGELLKSLITGMREEQQRLSTRYQRHVPVLFKVAPDLDETQLVEMAGIFVEEGIEGMIATNTTSGRKGVEGLSHAQEAGGLSGAPAFDISTHALKKFRGELPSSIPIIAAGGIVSADDAQAKLDAGAELVQIYTGFIYKGPKLVHDCITRIG
ncbi:MAG: quinone-dependent dihydroorotate dehydrogenase [bacterium]